jgi:hypothetical protein
MLADLTIPDAYAVPLILFVASGLVTFLAWVFRQGTETARLLASTAAELAEFRRSTDRRLDRLEGWRDGVQFAQAAQAAHHLIAPSEEDT